MDTDLISMPYQDGNLPAYKVGADSSRPALILIHEVWGLSDHIKSVADRLAKDGFEVLAPDLLAGTELDGVISPDMQNDLFDPAKRSQRQPEIRAKMAPLASPDFAKAVLDKLDVCFEYLVRQPNQRKVGVIGFCFGGTYSFGLATRQPQLAAAVPFYGHGEGYINDFGKISCPVMAFYGANDGTLNEHIPAIEAAMQAAGKDFTYKIYEDAGHAFFNDTNEFTYKPKAAADAWQLATDFLHKNLD